MLMVDFIVRGVKESQNMLKVYTSNLYNNKMEPGNIMFYDGVS